MEHVINVILMHKVLSFVDNRNILTEVPLIFKGKVHASMLNHLTEKAENYLDYYESHLKAWIEFIGHLDANNSHILCEYIAKKY